MVLHLQGTDRSQILSNALSATDMFEFVQSFQIIDHFLHLLMVKIISWFKNSTS